MNPSPEQIAMLASIRARDERAEATRRAALHSKAIARRRKAKRGGRR